MRRFIEISKVGAQNLYTPILCILESVNAISEFLHIGRIHGGGVGGEGDSVQILVELLSPLRNKLVLVSLVMSLLLVCLKLRLS